MLKIYNYEGKNEEELTSKSLEELNTTKKKVFINKKEIKGKLFIGKKIELQVLLHDDLINYIKEYFSNLSTLIGIEINPEIQIRDEILKINLITSNNSIMIGRNGRTINSIQSLLKQNINNNVPFHIKLNVDVSNYKSQKINYLEKNIINICNEVIKSKIDVKLDPMNSYERRIVHNIINKYEQLKSISEGSEPNRYVVIQYK